MNVVKRFLLFSAVFMFSSSVLLAQSAKKSSGVVEVKMSKKKAEKPLERNVSSTTFQMTKPVSNEQSQKTVVSSSRPGVDEIAWQSPSLNSINTSQSHYEVKATITSKEDLRVVNIFLNGTFYFIHK